jgi:hypothetical protein
MYYQDSKLKLYTLKFSLPGHELAIENLIAVQFVSRTASFSLDTELQLQQTTSNLNIYVKSYKKYRASQVQE